MVRFNGLLEFQGATRPRNPSSCGGQCTPSTFLEACSPYCSYPDMFVPRQYTVMGYENGGVQTYYGGPNRELMSGLDIINYFLVGYENIMEDLKEAHGGVQT